MISQALHADFFKVLFLFKISIKQKGNRMDITKTINEMKKEAGFADNVGMVLVHNGVVCAGGHAKTGVMLNILTCLRTMKR